MTSINVALKQNPYSIVVGINILSKLGAKIKALKIGKDAIIITSSPIYRRHGKKLERSLKTAGFSVKVITVPDGEKSKSAQTAIALIEKLARYDVFKQPFIVAFGGGVIGDLAGFVAATYKRGIPYVQVPTTFLAQIDSAIGGKTGVDLTVGKNLLGAFYQPKLVFSDVGVLKTLPKKQLRNGLAEAVKYGVIRDAKLFAFLEKNVNALLKADLVALQKVVVISSRIKTDVVLADEKETKNIRTILNYGHTLGHAIEAAGKFHAYQHGEAIGLGMRMSGAIAVASKLLSPQDNRRIDDLISAVGLPKKMKASIRPASVLKLMKHDKKFTGGKNKFVLAQRVGQVVIREGIPEKLIMEIIGQFKK